MRSIYTVYNLNVARHRLFRRGCIHNIRKTFQRLRYFRVKTFSQSKRVRDVSIEKGPFVRSIDILATATNTGRPKGRVLWPCPRWTGWFRGRSRYFGGPGIRMMIVYNVRDAFSFLFVYFYCIHFLKDRCEI